MISHRCKKCRWFDKQHSSLALGPGNLGYCRKHKPLSVHIKDRFYGRWPLVDTDDFCGEFRKDEET